MKYLKQEIILVQNKIYSINYRIRLINLILIFIQSSTIIYQLDFTFQSLATIIIYVGAISILFIFVIKLNTPNFNSKNTIRINIFIKILVSVQLIFYYIFSNFYNNIYEYNIQNYSNIYYTITNLEYYAIIQYNKQPFIIQILGIKLLVVLIGMFNKIK